MPTAMTLKPLNIASIDRIADDLRPRLCTLLCAWPTRKHLARVSKHLPKTKDIKLPFNPERPH